jgi:hypothetical protein
MIGAFLLFVLVLLLCATLPLWAVMVMVAALLTIIANDGGYAVPGWTASIAAIVLGIGCIWFIYELVQMALK